MKLARKLRKEMSLPEVLLWRELQKRPGGFKFRRQLPARTYAIDFACLSARLGIEVDGVAHNRGDRPSRDARRDARLESDGFTVLRIPAREILTNLEGALSWIVEHCKQAGPLRQACGLPPPRSGEELVKRAGANPPRNGEGDRPAKPGGGGGPASTENPEC